MHTVDKSCRYINEEKITIYVEHPVPLDPPVAEAPAPPMPLMLTAKEKKKIRKQRREEREKERQVCTYCDLWQVTVMACLSQCYSYNDNMCSMHGSPSCGIPFPHPPPPQSSLEPARFCAV